MNSFFLKCYEIWSLKWKFIAKENVEQPKWNILEIETEYDCYLKLFATKQISTVSDNFRMFTFISFFSKLNSFHPPRLAPKYKNTFKSHKIF